MTLVELEKYFGSFYKASIQTGMRHNTIGGWKKKGYIPIVSQMKIEKATDGKLKARFEDCK